MRFSVSITIHILCCKLKIYNAITIDLSKVLIACCVVKIAP